MNPEIPVRVQEQMAIEMVETGNAPSLTIAAAMVGAAPSTVMHRRQGRRNREEEDQRRQKLTPEEEQAVVERCYFRCRLGFPPTIWQLREIATCIVQKRDPGIVLGKRWEQAFKKRHEDVKTKFSKQLDFIRNIRGNDIQLMNSFFNELETIVHEYNIQPQNTYNIDEVGFLLGLGQSERVLEVIRDPRENGELKYRAQNGTREFITVIEGVCADGTFLNPTIILKAEEFIAEWFARVKRIPEDILFGRSHNGWTDASMAKEFLRRNFGHESLSAQKAQGAFRLLLFDGHSSHVNAEFLEFCILHKIIPYCLPPHTTHRLQPLDVCIFSPYKHQYQKELTRRFERHEYGVSKENFYEILMVARRAAFTPDNIRSGFFYTGLVPSNRDIIISKIQASRSRSPNHDSNPITPATAITHPIPERSQHLRTFTAQEIDSLKVPLNKAEIENQELIGLISLPRNDPVDWGLKRIISNLAVSARRGLTEGEEKDRQIQNLRNQLVEVQRKKTATRTRIPMTGKAWIDREDIARFFESQSREQREGTRRKYENATNLVVIRKQKLAECTRKRREAEKLEEEGKLPKSRKTGTVLLQEETHLTEQIAEAQQKVRKFEKHLEDMAQNVAETQTLEGGQEVETEEQFDHHELQTGGVVGELQTGGVVGEPQTGVVVGAGAQSAPAPDEELVELPVGLL